MHNDSKKDSASVWERIAHYMRAKAFAIKITLGVIFTTVIALVLLIRFLLYGTYEYGGSTGDAQYLQKADPGAVVQIDRIASHSEGLFSSYQTILFHTSNATMQKVVKYYHYRLAGEPIVANTRYMSDYSIAHAGNGRYRNIRTKPAKCYFASGPEMFTTRSLYWDPKTETGCIYYINSD